MAKKKITLKKGCIITVAVYIAVMLIFWLCAKEQLYSRMDSTEMTEPNTTIGEITPETVYTQRFTADSKAELRGITLYMATYNRVNANDIVFALSDDNAVLAEQTVNASGLVDNKEFTVVFNDDITLEKGHNYTFSVTSPNGAAGNSPTIYAGSAYAAGKADIEMDLSEEMQVHLNGQPMGYSFCWSVITETSLIWGKIFFPVAGTVGFVLIVYCVFLIRCEKNGKACIGLKIINAFSKYHYLIKQLVSRDFKTKYKRSVLGVLWSFLNPLLMMTVQYIVFSTLFKSSIANFALYLMIGIVCFNFFSECAGMCLGSITGNASLITKVYMPKYIYPVSRALSSSINLLFSLIPLVGVMLITHVHISKAVVLVPIPLICLFVFSLGIGMILATMMVFFRDTQFLWGVLSTIWMYMTPIFYPESILPAKYLVVFKLNPMYHIIRLMRTMIIDGVSPEPKAYIIALFMSFATLFIGAVIFKKNQDKFVLNI